MGAPATAASDTVADGDAQAADLEAGAELPPDAEATTSAGAEGTTPPVNGRAEDLPPQAVVSPAQPPGERRVSPPPAVTEAPSQTLNFLVIISLALSAATFALLIFMMLQRRQLLNELVRLRQEIAKVQPSDAAPMAAALKALQDAHNGLAIDLRARLEPMADASAKLLAAVERLQAKPSGNAPATVAAEGEQPTATPPGSWWPKRGALAELADHIRKIAPPDPQGSPTYYGLLRQYYDLAVLRQSEDRDADRWSLALHKFTEGFCRHLHAAWEHEDNAWEDWETHDEKLRESLLDLVAELNLPLHVQVIRRDDIFDHERMIKDSSGASSALRVRFPLSWIIGLKQNDRVKLLHRGLVIT